MKGGRKSSLASGPGHVNKLYSNNSYNYSPGIAMHVFPINGKVRAQNINRALKCHALSVSLTHFDAISRSHAGTSVSHAFALFW